MNATVTHGVQGDTGEIAWGASYIDPDVPTAQEFIADAQHWPGTIVALTGDAVIFRTDAHTPDRLTRVVWATPAATAA